MSAFLPLIDNDDSSLFPVLSRLGPLLIPSHADHDHSHIHRISLVDSSTIDSKNIIAILDAGADAVVVSLAQSKDLLGLVPAERVILMLDALNVNAIPDKTKTSVSGILIKTAQADMELVKSVASFFDGATIYVWASGMPQARTIRQLKDSNATLVIPTSMLTLEKSSPNAINIADAFMAPLTSDRPDGLFPTVVTSHDQSGRCLGLVYSSQASIAESITTGRGVYQSRKHGLWRKGETSGATQTLVKIALDCDSDALEFRVVQSGSGFCHLGTTSCFGTDSGLALLEKTLQSRAISAPEGSYTHRLFNDPALLHAKIAEEADELCRAEDPDQVAFEAADLIYFALTKCISKGVTLSDVEKSLDRKSKKVSRRPGNAKPEFQQAALPESRKVPVNGLDKPEAHTGRILMQKFASASISQPQRSALLKRPVLNSAEMIDKVKPIVEEVKLGGDKALLNLTAKYDKARLTENVLLPPFASESMELDADVQAAIDLAYNNIRKFHEAQVESKALTVETMPGVVCTRFTRAIARVGLYVPGGTAILPSTALMLGIPAQVAGCKQIVLATPPRPDGTISPEVMYVASKVGASAILRAGGAQAVAAMAYGTETVPKVDKIFGPGNQWVTAAKMLVQNDTNALVAIDMPAGPSEVLVIADRDAQPSFVAADLLSQAEHGVDSQVVLVAIDLPASLLDQIEEQVDVQAKALPRVNIIKESISRSFILGVASREEAIAFSNDYAPEHLILHVNDASELVRHIENAGSVFLGPWSPESCGDYASGTNHTLPTNGYARQFSGVSTLSFQKHITSQELSRGGLDTLGPAVATLADCEGLQAHANAVRIRLNLST